MMKLKSKIYQRVAIIVIAAILVFSVTSLNNPQIIYASSGLDVIVNAVTDSQGTKQDIIPTIIVAKDSQTFEIKKADLVSNDGITATSKAVFHFENESMGNGQQFLVCALFSYDEGFMDYVCDEGTHYFGNSTEIIKLDHALD